MASVVGIDLGCQNSVIATAGRGGVDVILNENSNRLNPSLVGFDPAQDGCRKMGEHASAVTAETLRYMKRLVGLAFDDALAKEEMKFLPFQCVPCPHKAGAPTIGVKVASGKDGDKVIGIEHVCGMMIKYIGQIASKGIEGAFPQDWVVAVPAYFSDAQRRALLVGCEMAGIKKGSVQRLIQEHTATALAYGMFKDVKKEFHNQTSPTNVMLIDMGASAYTVSVVAFEPGKLTVKSCFYDANLGGRDFDRLIAKWLADKFVEKYKNKKLSVHPWDNPKIVLKLMAAAEKAKKTLSPHGVTEVAIHLECLLDDLDFSITLKGDEFAKMCKPLLDRLEGPLVRAIDEIGTTAKKLIESVELVGGSTRINSLKNRILEIVSPLLPSVKTLSTTMNADESVARGAALQSAILSPRFKVLPYDIVEAQPLPIKCSWEAHGENDASSAILFDRGLHFPIVRRVTLPQTTTKPNTLVIQCAYDESARNYGLLAAAKSDIGTFSIKVSPSAKGGEKPRIRVNVKQDLHGIVTLSSAQLVEDVASDENGEGGDDAKKEDGAEEKSDEKDAGKKKISKTNLEFTISRRLDWTQEEINKAYEEEVRMENVDRIVRETADMRNELESYIYDMRDKLMSSSDTSLGAYYTKAEKDAFNAKLEQVENWLYEEGFDATKTVYAEKLGELKALGGPGEFRISEAEGRAGVVASLQKYVKSIQDWLNEAQSAPDDKYAHITQDEWDKCRKLCDDTTSWLYEKLDAQGGLPRNANPAFTISDVNKRSSELTKTCTPIMHKPKPKPAPVTPKAEPMDTDAAPDKMDES